MAVLLLHCHHRHLLHVHHIHLLHLLIPHCLLLFWAKISHHLGRGHVRERGVGHHRDVRQQLRLHRRGVVFVTRIASHLKAKRRFVATEKFMVIAPRLWTAAYPVEAPTIELASEACELARFEVFRQNIGCEYLLLVDNKRISMRTPRNDIAVTFI